MKQADGKKIWTVLNGMRIKKFCSPVMHVRIQVVLRH